MGLPRIVTGDRDAEKSATTATRSRPQKASGFSIHSRQPCFSTVFDIQRLCLGRSSELKCEMCRQWNVNGAANSSLGKGWSVGNGSARFSVRYLQEMLHNVAYGDIMYEIQSMYPDGCSLFGIRSNFFDFWPAYLISQPS